MGRLGTLGLIGLAGLALSASTAFAQFARYDFAVSAMGGFNAEDIGRTFEDSGVERRVENHFGLAVEFVPLRWTGVAVGVEGLASGTFGKVLVFPFRKLDFNYGYFQGNVVVHVQPPRSRIVPYATAGAGAVVLDPDVGRSVTAFVFNLGGGADVFFADRWSLRVDGRFHSFKFRAEAFDRETLIPMGIGANFDERQWDFTMTVGLRFRF